MKKFKKLLSVLMAVVMMISCFSILGNAFQEYEIDENSYYYFDSNDNPRVYLYTAEQRASIAMDTVDELLGSLGIVFVVDLSILGQIVINLSSYDALCATLDDGLISTALGMAGDLSDLEHGMLDGNTRAGDGDVASLNNLLYFAQKNADVIYNIINDGIDLGTIGSLANIDLTGINEILVDLPGFLGGLLYGLSDRQMTNGIGEDTAEGLGNSPLWDTIGTDEKNSNADYKLDTIVENLVLNLLTTPRNTIRITERSQNTLGDQALEEVLEDGTKNYYCYGTETAEDGTVTLVTTYEGDEEPYRHYLTRWDENSSLLKGKSAEDFRAAFSLNGKDLYTLLEDMIAWAYDAFAGHNLDGQLRATLMQFCGAFNNGDDPEYLNDEIKAQLKAIMDGYKLMEENASYDKSTLQAEFKNTVGVAGNYNFMYIALNDDGTVDTTANINTKPDNLYYVVEWGQSYQYYHVEFNNLSTFFDLIDWEYQAPTWAELKTTIGWEKGTSLLQHINNIVGTIITTAVNRTATVENEDGTTTSYSLSWTNGTTEGLLATNVTELVKLVIKADTRKLFGSLYTLPEGFDSFTLEQVIVELARILVPKLIPALILPDDVASVEEVVAYSVREFIAEIIPDTGASWDAALDAATTEDEYLDIALSMGCSIGVYYLQNLIGLGTTTDGANGTDTTMAASLNTYLNADTNWQTKLGYIINWVITTYVPNLTKNSGYSSSTVYSDPLGELSKIFSTLAPSFLKILGANTDSYALDLNHVYDDLRLALNGDFSELANGLMRKSSGTSANYTAIKALGTFLTELFGGLGMNVSGSDWAGDWSTLSGKFTTAYDATYPLQALLGDYGTSSTIAGLAQYFVSTLAYCRDYWFSDALAIILMIAGRESRLTNKGVVIDGIEEAYTGSTSAVLDFSFVMNTSGVREYFNDGRYKTGTGYMDGDFALYVDSVKVTDGNGNVKVNNAIGREVAPNEKEYFSFTVSNIQEDPQVYTLEIAYKIKSPTDSSFDDAELIYAEEQFIASSLLNDSLSWSKGTVTKTHGSADITSGSYDTDGSTKTSKDAVTTYIDAKWEYGFKNTYISEVEQLTKAKETMMYLRDMSTEYLTNDNASGLNVDYASKLATTKHTWSIAYVDGYGTNTVNDDGSISITDHSTTNFSVTHNGTAVDATGLWFKWNINDSTGLNNKSAWTSAAFGVAHDTTKQAPMWAVETTAGLVRKNFEEDYNSYKIAANVLFQGNWGDLNGSEPVWEGEMTVTSDSATAITTYITLFNSYDLASRIDANLGLKEENYPEAGDAWTEYENAVAYANLQMYGQWIASQFEADHTINVADITVPVDADGKAYEGYEGTTVSTFLYAGDRLEAAVAALAEYYVESEDDSEASEAATMLDPSDAKSPYYAAYAALQAMEEYDTSNHNYLLYTWFRFNDLRQSLRNAINALRVPDATAPNTLAGVPGDNEQIANVIAAINNDKLETIVNGLVEAPTEEAIKAAADAYAAYEEGYEALAATYDPAVLAADAATMKIYGTVNTSSTGKNGRLLAKYSTQQMHFLNDAISTYGNEVAADYSEGSYEVYADRLAEAKLVQADSTSTQYEIFSARYELLVAYKALIPAGEEVDMSALKDAMAEAMEIIEAIGTDDEKQLADDATVASLEEAYEQLVLAMGIEVEYDEEMYYIGGNYNGAYALAQEGKIYAIKEQGWVDGITANLLAAIDNFVGSYLAPILSGILETTGFVDTVNKYVYGIDIGGIINEFFQVANGTMNLVANDSGVTNGTGATLEVVDTKGEVTETYTVVIFGDVDGNGEVDGTDSSFIMQQVAGTSELDTVAGFAADVDGNGEADGTDSSFIMQVVAGTNSITTNPYEE